MTPNSFEGRPKVKPELLKQSSRIEAITEKEAQLIESSFFNRITRWHDEVKPNIIILTATSSTPYGYLIKRAWRVAFANEPQPVFMNIDARHFDGMDFRKNPGGREEDALPAKERIGENDRVLVFDEMRHYNSQSPIQDSNLQKVSDIKKNPGRSLSLVIKYLKKLGVIREENLYIDDGGYYFWSIVQNRRSDDPFGTTNALRSPLKRNEKFVLHSEDNHDYEKLHTYLAKPSGKSHRQIAQGFIRDMEYIGQKIGEQIRDTSSK